MAFPRQACGRWAGFMREAPGWATQGSPMHRAPDSIDVPQGPLEGFQTVRG